MKHRKFAGTRLVLFNVIAVLVGGMATAAPAMSSRIPICHFPQANPDYPQPMVVSRASAVSHVRMHGDDVCAPGATDCCPSDGSVSACTNVDSDALNCGQCGNECASDEACVGGECVVSDCVPGDIVCDGVCVDPESDRDNCGQCGAVCGADQECVGGVCLVTCPEN